MEKKVKLVKAYIVFCVLCTIIMFYFILREEKIGLVMLGVVGCLDVLLLYFLSKVDLYSSNPKVEPVIKCIDSDNFEEFANVLFEEAEKKGFCDTESIVSNDGIEMLLAFQHKNKEVTTLQAIWMKDFNETLLENATELFWKEIEKKIGKRKIQGYAVQLIQCICVEGMNEDAREFVNQNLPQDVDRYQTLSIISFEEKQIYICQTKHKIFDERFKDVEGIFLEIAKKILR